jgi:DNA-binding Xre family transcriptional regulator
MPRSLCVRYDWIEKVKLAVISNGYANQRDLAEDTGLSLATVSNFLTGKPVNYRTVQELCRKLNLDWQEITTTSTEVISTPHHNTYKYAKKTQDFNKFQDWGTAIDISRFYGRREELIQLESWIIQDSCRLIGLFGTGGVGKTTLVTQLAKQIQNHFDYVFWRSVPTVPSFDSMITDFLSFVSNNRETKLDINRVIHYLRVYRCLIIWDHLDPVLDTNNIKYTQLIQIIAETHHQSCLIFTSQSKPAEFSFMEKWTLSVRSLELLASLEIAFSLIQSKQLFGTDQQKHELCYLYRNNPLKIKIVVSTIIDLFDGDIGNFLQQKSIG